MKNFTDRQIIAILTKAMFCASKKEKRSAIIAALKYLKQKEN